MSRPASSEPLHPAGRAPGWAGLLIAPLAALGSVSLGHALVTPACAAQAGGLLHLVIAAALAIALACTVSSWRGWRRSRPGEASRPDGGDGAGVGDRNRFVALAGTLTGGFFSLVIVAQWVAQWLLSPCLH
jgi:hypothetical protein